MALPREYKKFIGNYNACKSGYGRRMLRKFGFGPETEVKEVVKDVVEKVVKTPKPKKKKTTTRKKKAK
jgi:hypothetical protein